MTTTEVVAGPDGAEAEVELEVWLSNRKNRRATLTVGQLERPTGLALKWAVAV
ncbi:hypothetical protein [Streptomyces sp. NPDC017524]|uniref:hypothetical protein n=1 Tax=unclassified Streptomyces TaxID=2593676 RepID=UPI00379DBF59